MNSAQKELLPALQKLYGKENILAGKGGYWIKNKGFITTSQARKITGIKSSQTRQPAMVVGPAGEWAFVAMFNGYKF